MVAEDLVSAFGPGVVVAVALEVEQEDVGEEVVAVPAVFGAGAFVAAVFEFSPVQAVVFEVVDGLQQQDPDGGSAEPGRSLEMGGAKCIIDADLKRRASPSSGVSHGGVASSRARR